MRIEGYFATHRKDCDVASTLQQTTYDVVTLTKLCIIRPQKTKSISLHVARSDDKSTFPLVFKGIMIFSSNLGGNSSVLERRVDDQKVADPWFDYRLAMRLCVLEKDT